MKNIHFETRDICALSLDVVGYSRLLAANAERTVKALSDCVALIDSVIADYEGRIITRAGDGFLIGFTSHLCAIKSAIACQTLMRERNKNCPPADQIWLRAGIACGRVIDDGQTAHGDCLNISVRMQEAAPSGGILMTQTVHDMVKKDLSYTSTQLGNFHFKNLDLNIAGVELHMDGADVFSPHEPLLDLVTIAGEVDKMSGFDRRTSLAVFPMQVSASADNGNNVVLGAIGEGVSDSLMGALSFMRQFPLIDRNSVFHYKDSNLPPPRVWKLLDASYVINGEVSQGEDCVRLTMRLIHTKDGQTVWSESFKIPQNNLTQTIDDISVMVAGTIETCIENEEGLRARSTQISKLDLNALVWRARWHAGRLTPGDALQARQLLEKVLAQERDFPEAVMQLAHLDWLECWFGGRGKTKADIQNVIAIARKATVLSPKDSRGHALVGGGYILLGEPEEALEYLRHANNLNPGYSLALLQMGACHMLMNQPKQAIRYMQDALRLNSTDFYVFMAHSQLSACFCLIGDWDSALSHARKSRSLRNNYVHARMCEITALVGLGRLSDAAKAYDALMLRYPKFDPRKFFGAPVFQKQTGNQVFISSVERARSAALLHDRAAQESSVYS